MEVGRGGVGVPPSKLQTQITRFTPLLARGLFVSRTVHPFDQSAPRGKPPSKG
jgi:hypothetical protein